MVDITEVSYNKNNISIRLLFLLVLIPWLMVIIRERFFVEDQNVFGLWGIILIGALIVGGVELVKTAIQFFYKLPPIRFEKNSLEIRLWNGNYSIPYDKLKLVELVIVRNFFPHKYVSIIYMEEQGEKMLKLDVKDYKIPTEELVLVLSKLVRD